MNIKKLFTSKSAEIERLNQSLTEWATKGSDYDKKITELQDTIGKFMEEKETFNKQMEDLKSEYENKIKSLTEIKDKEVENLEQVVVDTTNSTEDRAVDLVASLGVQPDLVKVTNSEVNPQDIYNKWMNLCKSDAKLAQDYYKLNRETINKLTGLKTK